MQTNIEKVRAAIAIREEQAVTIRDAAVARLGVLPGDALPLAARITGRDLWAALDLDASDIDNAKRMIAHHDQRLICVEGLGSLSWDGRRWALDEKTDAAIERAAEATAEAISLEAAIVKIAYDHDLVEHYCVAKKDANAARKRLADDAIVYCYEELVGRAAAAKSLKSIKAMVHLAENHMLVPAAKLDARRDLLSVLNGTINLMTGEVIPHDPDHYITQLTPITVPTWEDANGRRWVCYDKRKAPTWMKATTQAFLGDMELIGYVQRMIGYWITGETREQQFFLLYGIGSNMKGRLMTVVQKLAPEASETVVKDLFMKSRFKKELGGTNEEVADLRGARIIHAEEIDRDDVLDEPVMKRLSGGGKLKAAKKYQSSLTFQPCGKCVAELNDRPRIHSQEPAIWRRVVEIPFLAHFSNPGDPDYQPGISLPKDETLDVKLEAELPQILAWAVEGAMLWYEHGLRRDIPEPKKIVEARQAYREDTDVLADFLHDACDIDGAATQMQGQLYDAYDNYCRLTATGNAISRKAFGKALEERKFASFDRAGNRFRKGLCLNKAGWSYHGGFRPKDEADLSVVPTTRHIVFRYRLDDLPELEARCLDDLPEDVMPIVADFTKGKIPEVGVRLMTDRGLFERTA